MVSHAHPAQCVTIDGEEKHGQWDLDERSCNAHAAETARIDQRNLGEKFDKAHLTTKLKNAVGEVSAKSKDAAWILSMTANSATPWGGPTIRTGGGASYHSSAIWWFKEEL